METVRGTLLEIGLTIERQTGSFGGAPKSPEEYIRSAVRRIQEIICPHSPELLKKLKEPTTELATILFDLVSPYIGNPVPGLGSVTKKIAEIGLTRFCADPEGTLGKAADV